VLRTEHDLPLRVVGIGAAAVFLLLTLAPQAFSSIEMTLGRAVAALLVIVFAFFFVTVSSRIVGMVGVTSNPTSGMAIATLLGTSSIFLLLGWTDDAGKIAAITVGAVVAISASIAGDTSQDLKTGMLLGATPRRQQMGELVGVITSAGFVAMTVLLLGRAYGFGGQELPAPQATLMKLVIDGVLAQELPWTLVGIGAGISIVAELFRIPSLPFAVGVYLPVSVMVPVFVGGLLRMGLERSAPDPRGRHRPAGPGHPAGVRAGGRRGPDRRGHRGAAAWAVANDRTPWSLGYEWAGAAGPWLALALFAPWCGTSGGCPSGDGLIQGAGPGPHPRGNPPPSGRLLQRPVRQPEQRLARISGEPAPPRPGPSRRPGPAPRPGPRWALQPSPGRRAPRAPRCPGRPGSTP
jgi:hypothetical protein